jgi:hypothetical protein
MTLKQLNIGKKSFSYLYYPPDIDTITKKNLKAMVNGGVIGKYSQKAI